MLRVSVIALLILAASVAAKPDRKAPDEKPKPLPMLPMLAGVSNWGVVTQDGRKIAISGHPHWFASGEIRKDGTVLLLWTLVDGGRSGQGVYTVDSGDLTGQCGWGDEVELDEDGSLKGQTKPDRTYKLKPQPE